jgi:hypothetical protein
VAQLTADHNHANEENTVDLFPGTSLEPLPPPFEASLTVAWAFTALAGGALIALLPWAILRLVRQRNSVPLLALLGGGFASLNEPLIDHMVHVAWPTGLPGDWIHVFGLNVPPLIVPCYMVFVGGTGYWAYHRFRQGVGYGQVFAVWSLMCLSDIVLEVPGVQMGAYKYYGQQTFFVFDFPLHIAWANGTSFLLVGLLLYTLLPRARGWERPAVAFFAPVFGFMGGWAVADWPVWIANNSNVSLTVANVLALGSLVLSVLAVHTMARIVLADQATGDSRLAKTADVSSSALTNV